MDILFLNGEKFINVATGVDAGVGHDLESCTSEIGIVKMTYPDFNIVLVDTPGLDNTKITDSDILKIISDWLGITYIFPKCTEDTADR